MASVHAIEISDEEGDAPTRESLPDVASKTNGMHRSEDHDDAPCHSSEEYDDALPDIDGNDDDVSLHMSDLEEEDIFAAKLQKFEVLQQQTADRLASEPLPCQTPSPPPLSPTPEPSPAATGAAKRPAPAATRRSKRRRGETAPERNDDFDLDVEELDAESAAQPAPRRTLSDRSSLEALITQLAQTDDEKWVEDSPVCRPESADSITQEAERTFTARVQAGRLIIRLQMKRCDRLQRLFDAVAAELSVPVGRVCLGQRDVIYSPHQTPDDVRLGPFDVIEFWEGDSAAAAGAAGAAAAADADSIELKVQAADRRSSALIRLKRSDPMSVLMERYAAERGVPLDELRFRFDGEPLDPTDTAETLDLDGGECVDVHSC